MFLRLFFKEQQAGCLVGAIAGQMEMDGKSKVPNLLGANTIGAVGGIPYLQSSAILLAIDTVLKRLIPM